MHAFGRDENAAAYDTADDNHDTAEERDARLERHFTAVFIIGRRLVYRLAALVLHDPNRGVVANNAKSTESIRAVQNAVK